MTTLIPLTRIERKILLIRGQKVLLDYDLAELYGVPTKRLNEQVKRNLERFPSHFMFQLTDQEVKVLRSQIATANDAKRRSLPYAFTEHGTLQAANVLNSPEAIKVGILIIEAFVKLREQTANQSAIIKKLSEHEKQIGYLFKLMEELASPPKERNYSTRKIGFMREEGNEKARLLKGGKRVRHT